MTISAVVSATTCESGGSNGGLTQHELARRADVPTISVSHFETGHRFPTSESLSRLADALGVSADYLLGRVSDPVGKAPSAPIQRSPSCCGLSKNVQAGAGAGEGSVRDPGRRGQEEAVTASQEEVIPRQNRDEVLCFLPFPSVPALSAPVKGKLAALVAFGDP